MMMAKRFLSRFLLGRVRRERTVAAADGHELGGTAPAEPSHMLVDELRESPTSLRVRSLCRETRLTYQPIRYFGDPREIYLA